MQDSHTLPPEKVHLHSFPLYMITSLCVMCLGSSLNCSFFFITVHDSLVVYLKDISVQIVADMPPLTCAGTCLSISPQLTSYGSFHLSIYILYFVHLYAVFFWRILAPLCLPRWQQSAVLSILRSNQAEQSPWMSPVTLIFSLKTRSLRSKPSGCFTASLPLVFAFRSEIDLEGWKQNCWRN